VDGACRGAGPDREHGHTLRPPNACSVLSRRLVETILDRILLSAYYAEHGLVVNFHGECFVDEGEGELSGLTNNAACQPPPGGLWIVLEAGTVAELAQDIERHGVNGGSILETVSDSNASVKGDAAEGLAVPKTIAAHKIEMAPFYTTKVAPGVSRTYGDVAINDRAEVLDKDGAMISSL
jgi:hypothetical protein